MHQIKAFIEKAKSDSDLMAKLDALGRKGAEGVAEVIALAAEYGFTVTKEDMEAARCQNCPHHGELSEEDLGAVSGGATVNRYDKERCSSRKSHLTGGFDLADCVDWWAFLGFVRPCDHFRKTYYETKHDGETRYLYECGYGYFRYVGTSDYIFCHDA